jgi:hypothetical protein
VGDVIFEADKPTPVPPPSVKQEWNARNLNTEAVGAAYVRRSKTDMQGQARANAIAGTIGLTGHATGGVGFSGLQRENATYLLWGEPAAAEPAADVFFVVSPPPCVDVRFVNATVAKVMNARSQTDLDSEESQRLGQIHFIRFPNWAPDPDDVNTVLTQLDTVPTPWRAAQFWVDQRWSDHWGQDVNVETLLQRVASDLNLTPEQIGSHRVLELGTPVRCAIIVWLVPGE